MNIGPIIYIYLKFNKEMSLIVTKNGTDWQLKDVARH